MRRKQPGPLPTRRAQMEGSGQHRMSQRASPAAKEVISSYYPITEPFGKLIINKSVRAQGLTCTKCFFSTSRNTFQSIIKHFNIPRSYKNSKHFSSPTHKTKTRKGSNLVTLLGKLKVEITTEFHTPKPPYVTLVKDREQNQR